MKKIFYTFCFIVMALFFETQTFAQHGKVLSLDGVNGYMVVADKPELNINTGQNFSITCWANTSDFGKRIVSKRIAGGGAGYEFIDNNSPGGQFGVNLRSTAAVNAGPSFGTTIIANSSWHHLAMVINVADNTCRIYVDGALQQTSTNTAIGTGSFANTINLFFGTTTGLTPFMNIQLDDIRIWSTALSATAVSADMTTIVTGTETNLVAAWDFENVAGTSVPDITTGNAHPGTLNGGASIVSLPTMSYSSTSLLQTELPAGQGDSGQRIIAVNVTTTGSTNPISLSSLSLTMAGTTNIADVTGIKIYYTGANNRFNTNTLFATAAPATGTVTATGNQTLVNGSNYFWIAYDISSAATEGNLLDATCEGITVGGNPVTFSSPNNTVAGSRTILLSQSLLFSPGDLGSSNYRIPAIITAADGSLVTMTDMRRNNSGDLPNNIDLVTRRSTDNGKTWSAPLIVTTFGSSGAGGAGDASLVLDKSNGQILAFFASNVGFSSSTPGTPIRINYIKSTDNGQTWSASTDITNQIYGSGCSNPVTQTWNAAFVASGRAHQLRNGTIAAVLAVRQTSAGTVDNFMISSADHGVTWTPSTGIAAASQANEAKVVELDNGNLLMSTRHPGSRLMSTSTDKGVSWGTATSQSQLIEPGCDGDCIRYTSTVDGFNKSRLLHSIPFNSTTRKNVSVFISYDEGTGWNTNKTIYPQSSAYSSLTILPDGTIGVYYECGEYGDVYDMYFARFSLNWLTNGADTYVPANTLQPPAVSITAPANNASFTAGSNITINANASSPNTGGSITSVKFYQGSTLLGTVTTSPYSFVWNSVAAGTYALTAVATDNRGVITTSATINITVNASVNQPPTVSITSPVNNGIFATGSTVTINANASSPNTGGSITKVDFYQGSTLLGTAASSPYSVAWSNVTAGTYALTAVATDNGGLTTTSGAVNITVSSCPSGNVLVLNGSTQYMYVVDHSDINIGSGQSKTITVWIRSTAIASVRVLSKRAASFGAGYEFITSTSGVLGLNAKSTTGTGLGAAFTSTPNVMNSTWHHVAMVIDQTPATGKSVKMYVDGTLISTGPLFNTAMDLTNTVNLIAGGTSQGSPAGQFKGELDNIRIWNRAMSATDIASDMNSIVSGPATGLLAGWDFEGAAGTNVPDISGNNHPGTLVGNPSIVNLNNAPVLLAMVPFFTGAPAADDVAFRVKVSPNPGSTHFNLNVQSNNTEIIEIRILNVSGVMLKHLYMPYGQTVQFGGELHPGIYFAEIRQGTHSVQVKLIKL